MEKADLYKQVRATVGDRSVNMKAVEEFSECIVELSSAVVKIMHGERIDSEHRSKIISEIADVIVTLEQITYKHNIAESVKIVSEFKVARLEKYLESGELLKGLMK